jgi:hypothetical protein
VSLTEQRPEEHLRAWAKAYRDSPMHRFPCDPHAEFFPVDLDVAAAEIERLRKAIARIAHSNAQNGEDAMKMRNIATAILYPEKAHIYDPTCEPPRA